jgi:hypothetical protein
MRLLTEQSAKIDKSQNDEWLNAVLYLEPDYNVKVCPAASMGCRKTCLKNSGRMRMEPSKKARYNRTKLYFEENALFMMALKGEIASLLMKARKEGKKLAMRLNGTSDLDWSEVYQAFPMVQFYEYTKRPDLIIKNAGANVHYTFSRTETTKQATIDKVTKRGVNVAVVFKSKDMPAEFNGLPVVNGDKHDRRFEDKQGVIVGLSFKGTKADKQAAIDCGFAI